VVLPARPNERNDSEHPKCQKSSPDIENPDPSRDSPCTDTTRASACIDTALLMRPKLRQYPELPIGDA
jgi:hypothetical protein